MKKFFIVAMIFFGLITQAQDWSLKLRSRVELRSWRLTTRADKTEKNLNGAAVTLQKGDAVIGQTTTDAEGNFEIDVPANGDFMLVITYAGCNTKKFAVSTKGVPESVGKDSYKPTISIGGFMMAKPIKGVDYIGLDQPLVKVEYKSGGQNFDKDEAITFKGMDIVSKIYDAEVTVMEKFCNFNKQGDDALKKKNCALAKECYQKAMNLLPGEFYPEERMKSVEQCIKAKEAKEDAVMLEKLRQEELAKAANQKAIDEKKVKDKEQFNKSVNKNAVAKTEPKKETKAIVAAETTSAEDTRTSNESKGSSKYRMPKVIGANHYKEIITKADNYFKTKRYKDAKHAYEEALKHKTDDTYATGRVAECEKFLVGK
ncbi:MAG: CarboxypepD reg-like domain [Bacteroidetes bacterium]|jgi:hypothetical protein|nr:CarboxypepD reg-like domain [Bacteroidota bacterium]